MEGRVPIVQAPSKAVANRLRFSQEQAQEVLDRRYELIQIADTLWKEYSKSGAEKRADTLHSIFFQKNAPTSKALAEKAAAKKRPAGTSEAPPSKKAKGFTAKRKKTTRPVPKVVIDLPAKEETKEEPAEVDSRALVAYTGPAEQPDSSQPDEVVILDDAEQSSKPDAAVDGSAFSGPVAQLVGQMPAAYRTASRSSGESYYSNVVRTLRVGGRPMSPSNKQTVVIPIRCTDESNLSDKGKGPAVVGSPSLSDDESSPAFGKMSSSDREKLKTELFKCFPETYIKGLRGASSGHVGYMSQLAAELFARSMITEDWAKELRKENKKLVHDVTAAADHAQFVISSKRCCTSKPKLLWKKGRLSWNLRSKSIYFG
ncbi:uncharacterized protein LOC125496925 [Beta vulgaris subsp. vulgaris]|uniref:uncharacterized protein LOC125496925 n=1 Tax=Beta vulgaris subsp. vulgaris TaxID=3555 RepID=UPI002547EC25|nr:uncharacterized protein LOC125496925 [Beta vulgaris subsp. vulgaris]